MLTVGALGVPRDLGGGFAASAVPKTKTPTIASRMLDRGPLIRRGIARLSACAGAELGGIRSATARVILNFLMHTIPFFKNADSRRRKGNCRGFGAA